MNNYLISIIIPIYNSSSTLIRTIESLNIPYGRSDVEVILVDDGSTDNSYDLYKIYYSTNNNIKYLKKTNGGPSSARNHGIANSSGNFITFLDSDDTVSNDFLRDYFECTLKNYDLVVMGYKLVNDKTNKTKHEFYPNIDNKVTYTTEELFNILKTRRLEKQIWNKLYKRSILDREKILFNENIKIGEDFSFNLSYISHVNSTFFLQKANYNHHTIENSLSRSYKVYKFDHLKIVNDIYYHFLVKHGMNTKRAYLSRVNNVITCIADLSFSKNMTILEKISHINKLRNDEYLDLAYKSLSNEQLGIYSRIKIWMLKYLNSYFLYTLFKITRFIKR